ncbi:hypothetical protein NEFER03_1806 [Nematocida sp. LUAm3]|nr:hypothetical protein NEFER03_1806 [Nematocida sp. LUAm3]KAI5173887.1 hypothetical protein NEFER02_0354 [Nematocida sp. LUAm2]KAI5177368.1 hypothetical protein NEFER01_0643 [Nematocida sp. LUAm1]
MPSDSLLEELLKREERINELLHEASSIKRELAEASAKYVIAVRHVEQKNKEIKQATAHLLAKDAAIARTERKCSARIKRELQLRKLPMDKKDEKIICLEWIVRQLAEKLNIPPSPLLALTEICKVDDALLRILLLGTRNVAGQSTEQLDARNVAGQVTPPNTECLNSDTEHDLIAYLDENGIRSMLDVSIDQSNPHAY